MRIIKIECLPNGGHDNQSWTQSTIPDGWALIPEDMEIPNTYPFVNLEVEDGVVVSMTAGVVPEPQDTRTPAQKREHEYETTPCISWGGEQITVDQANQKWSAYTAEGDVETAQELTALIAEAKANIRKQIPNEE